MYPLMYSLAEDLFPLKMRVHEEVRYIKFVYKTDVSSKIRMF
jgi:hypothetical protein